MNEDPNLGDDLVALGNLLDQVTAPPEGWPAELGALLTRLRLEGQVRNGLNRLSPYPHQASKLHPRWRVERNCYQSAPDIAHVRATLHTSDLPTDPAQVAAVFASVPDGARIFDDDGDPGWLEASWNEPSTEADRAAMEAEVAERRAHAEFEAWQQQRDGNVPVFHGLPVLRARGDIRPMLELTAGAHPLQEQLVLIAEDRNPWEYLAETLPSWERSSLDTSCWATPDEGRTRVIVRSPSALRLGVAGVHPVAVYLDGVLPTQALVNELPEVLRRELAGHFVMLANQPGDPDA